ncbi:MAG: helix-turn-helix domain-containing protein [Clostridia bacterium]|nr:helix-turn-helix domain-containing protein [Clostridia bacterium]
MNEIREKEIKSNKLIKNPGDKHSLMTSDFFNRPDKGAHGIKGRQIHLTKQVFLHSHEHYEMEYILEGEMVNYINGTKVVMKPGDFYLLGTNDYHEVIPRNNSVHKLSMFFYLPATDSAVKQFLESSRCPIVGTIPEIDRPAFEALFRQVYETENYRVFEHTDSVSLAALLALHIAYRSNPSFPGGKKPSTGYIQTALRYILSHYQEPLTLDSVAKFLGLSPTYFCRLFASQMEVSFLDYLSDVRIQKAKSLLIFDPQKSITQIALEVGFESYSSFYRCFLNIIGVSPKEFRSQKQKKQKT